MHSLLGNLSAEQLRRAAEIKEQIDSLQGELDRLIRTSDTAANRPRRRMSPTTIAKMRAAQRARWASVRNSTGSVGDQKGRRRKSAALKARLSEIAKARWKKVKAAGRSAL